MPEAREAENWGQTLYKVAIRYCAKGQLISKRNSQAKDSPKKPTNEFIFTSMRCVFVPFFGQILGQKKSFRDYLTFSVITTCWSMLVSSFNSRFFETGTIPTPTKLQNQTVSCQGGLFHSKMTPKNRTLEGKNRTLGGRGVKNPLKLSDIIYVRSLNPFLRAKMEKTLGMG